MHILIHLDYTHKEITHRKGWPSLWHSSSFSPTNSTFGMLFYQCKESLSKTSPWPVYRDVSVSWLWVNTATASVYKKPDTFPYGNHVPTGIPYTSPFCLQDSIIPKYVTTYKGPNHTTVSHLDGRHPITPEAVWHALEWRNPPASLLQER
jgi:hypothetical protein